VKSLEANLRERLGTKVSLNPTENGGTIVIHYYSEEELESILNQILD
jgi:ParB family chromosome partitioning protein